MADVRELARQLGEAVVTDEKFVALQSAQAEYETMPNFNNLFKSSIFKK